MKRIIAALLTIFMLLSLVACGTPASAPEATQPPAPVATDAPESPPAPTAEPEQAEQVQPEKSAEPPADEYERAIWYGFVPEDIQGDLDKTITFRQYSEILTNLIRLWDESRLPEWEQTVAAAAASDEDMRREDGIVEIAYAMVLMGQTGGGYDHKRIASVLSITKSGAEGPSWEYPLFPSWDEIVFEWCGGNYIWGGITTCATRLSAISGLPVFPLESEADYARLQEPLTRREAVLSVLRLAESDPEALAKKIDVEDMDFTEADAWERDFLAAAQARREEILCNNEELPCTGTAYYVSNSGSDDNDGLSPETAFATMQKLYDLDGLYDGDGVYFERGGSWRGTLPYKEGIIISAYGVGEKPILYGSTESGADGANWTLHHQGDAGEKIWLYKNSIPECTGVVLGDESLIARRVIPWFDGKDYYFADDRTKPFDLISSLRVNHSFYCEVPIPPVTLPIDPREYYYETRLYLRCDEGNPGEVFAQVEFMNVGYKETPSMIHIGKGTVVDNLCIKCFSGTALGLRDGCTVQNCEIGYGGASLWEYFLPTGDEPGIWTDGNGILFIGSDVTIKNNYLHDLESHGLNFEFGGDYEDIVARIPFSGVEIVGNIVERCGESYYVANNQDGLEYAMAFDGMLIKDNYFMNAGYGWYEGPLSYINPNLREKLTLICLNFGGRPNIGGHTMKVVDNVFYRAVNSLVCTCGQIDSIPQFENNTFAQSFGNVCVRTAAESPILRDPIAGQEKVNAAYGEDAGVVIVLRP